MKRKSRNRFLAILTFTAISSFSIAQTVSSLTKPTANLRQGFLYSRTSFPGHPLNDSLKKIDYVGGDNQYQENVIQELKQYQRSIKGVNEQEIKDAYFISGIMVMPAYSRMYFNPEKELIKTDALGYHQELLINHADDSAVLVLADRDKANQGTVNFNTRDISEVWQKYRIDAEQYTSQKTNDITHVAGYNCRKIIYTFGGTSRGSGVSNYIINLQPQKVTVWYNEDLPASINRIHQLDFELNKAVLRFEVEYDKVGKNKMLVEVLKIEPQKIDEKEFDLTQKAPVVQHVKNGNESAFMIMQVMMYAISLLTK